MFFSTFRAAYNQGWLTIESGLHFFFSLSKDFMTCSLSLAMFCWPNFFHRRDYDEQNAVVEV